MLSPRLIGIIRQIPRNIEEALSCLRHSAMNEILGHDVIDNYLAVKDAENETLQKLTPEERRKWLIERY